jgi:cell division protein FtsI (penicillin-binding protein 3)
MAGRSHGDPLRFRRRILLGVWLLSGAAVLVRAGEVQVVQGSQWRDLALRQQRTAQEIPASRGRILDREGVPLVETQEQFEVGVAPHEVQQGDPARVLAALRSALDLSERSARRIVESKDRWVHVGRFPPSVQGELRGLRGVYLKRLLRRDYPQGRMALGVLGSARDGQGYGGVEQTFDAVLRGQPGRAIVAKDPSGRVMGGQIFQMEAPVPGADLTLTLDADLQAIAKESLMAAVDSSDATGGDLLVTDPHTGEILAAVSVKDGVDAGLSFISEPVEPGSTIKPFILATLLSRGRASLDDEVDVGEGTWSQCGRVVHDVSARGVMTLARAVQVSSNVAMAMKSQDLTPEEEWEGLRDFGFGESTGIAIPGESEGILRRPEDWTCQSLASHAIGYEISATPLQMAMAYGALANGGELMEPRLVKEIRYPGGERETWEPRAVRRVIRSRLAEKITDVLVGVVDDGTGTAAGLASFTVAGKSGTARAYVDGDYNRNRYFSSFVGYFPAEDPQLVIYAKLDEAKGYGGALAGPVTRATMEAALAARGTPIHLEVLPQLTRTGAGAQGRDESVIRFASTVSTPAPPRTDPSEVARAWQPDPEILEVQVPGLRGLPLREASQRLHALGLRVRVEGTGSVRGSRPSAGALVMTGDTVVLRSGRATR